MFPDLPELQFAALEQTHKMRTGDIEQIGGLLGRYLGTDRQHRNGFALAHLRENIHEQPKRSHRHLDVFTSIDHAKARRRAAADASRKNPATLLAKVASFFCREEGVLETVGKCSATDFGVDMAFSSSRHHS